MKQVYVAILVVLSGCAGEKSTRIRIKNDTGVHMSRITIGSPYESESRLTATNLAPRSCSAYIVATNFVFPCSVWTTDSTAYMMNSKLLHSPEQKTLHSGEYTVVVTMGSDNPVDVRIEKP